MSSRPPIVFLRHGETDWNAEGQLQGQRDIPLNDKGRSQAHRNGAVVAEAVPGVAAYDFVSSPLIRSRETMEIARRAMALPHDAYRTDDRLKELAFGRWEGLTTPEIEGQNAGIFAERERDKWHFTPPDGESYRGLAARVDGWLKSVSQPTLVVAHGGVGRVLLMHLLGEDPFDGVHENIPQDRILVVRDRKGAWL